MGWLITSRQECSTQQLKKNLFLVGWYFVQADFLPGQGAIYKVDPKSGNVTTLITGLWAADGAWIDQEQDLLYVSEVVLGVCLFSFLTSLRQNYCCGYYKWQADKRL